MPSTNIIGLIWVWVWFPSAMLLLWGYVGIWLLNKKTPKPIEHEFYEFKELKVQGTLYAIIGTGLIYLYGKEGWAYAIILGGIIWSYPQIYRIFKPKNK